MEKNKKNEKRIKYNAFISYNHNPRDMAVARNLQTKLERYRIPKGLKTAKGIDDIERVFLDVGELGVAADLNDTIKDALDNTDYLIVISSPEYKASQWCHKEVEHFLMTHSADQILTVLTDGEPIDVLPNEVMHQKVVAEDGSVTYVDREPLSCDYRNGIKEGNRKELERLVAGIIGCRYDDLVQRQRQYKTRRMMISFSALTAVMIVALSYFVWSNHTISKNYNNTLKEQSRSLAMQSEKAMSGGDKVGAIKYALQALPSEDEEKPVVAEAVRALSRAMEMYQSKKDGIEATRELLANESLYNIEAISEKDRHILAATTYKGDVFIFDTGTGEMLAKECLDKLGGGDSSALCFLPGDSKAVIVKSDSVAAVDYAAEKELWNLKSEENEYISTGAAAASEKKVLFQKTKYNAEGKADTVVSCINLERGEVIFEMLLPKKDEKTPHISSIEISPDEKNAVMKGTYYAADRSEPCLLHIDLKNGKIVEIKTEGIGEVDDVAFSENGSLIICGIKGVRDKDLTQNEDRLYQIGGMSRHQSITGSNEVVVICMDENAEDEIWRAEYKETFSGISEIARDRNYSADTPIVINGSKLREFGADGMETARMETQSRIKFAGRTKEGDSIIAVLEDGGGASYTDGDDFVRIISNYFHDSIILCERVEGSYYLVCYDEDGGGKFRILKYVATTTGDKKWEAYERHGDSGAYSEGVTDYDDSFIEVYEKNNQRYIERIKAEDGKSLWRTELGETPTLHNLDALTDKTHGRLIVSVKEETDYENGRGKIRLESINLNDGKAETLETTTDGKVNFAELVGISNDGRIVICYNDYDGAGACIGFVDTDKNEITSAALSGMQEISYSTKLYYDKDRDIILAASEGSISVYKADGTLLFELKDLAYTVKAVTAGFDDSLYVVGETANPSAGESKIKMYSYDIKSGTDNKHRLPLGESLVKGDFLNIFGSIEIRDISETEYLIRMDERGIIVDKESGLLRAELPDMKAYNEKEGFFFIDNGCAPHRSVPEMIKEAKSLY